MRRAITLFVFIFFACMLASATTGFPYGSSCQGACGIGSNIIVNTIKCRLVDTSDNDTTQDCGTSLSDYNPATLPANLDTRAIAWEWDTSTAASGCVVVGEILNTTNRKVCQYSGGNVVISTHHRVVVHDLVPASAGGNSGNPTSYYLASSTDATASNPGGTIPGANYGNGWSAYPGPQCIQSGPPCHFNVYTPNPTATFPMQWEVSAPGQVSAWPGFPASIPLQILWNGGNATSLAGLGASCTVGQVGHTYTANSPSAPNTGVWYTCKNVGGTPTWVQNQSSPVFLWTASLVIGGNTYTCGADANGGADASTRTPTSTCKSGALDSGISITPFYSGIWSGSTPQTLYRQIKYSAANNAYYTDMNGTSVPLNPQPNVVVDFFPAASAATGTVTLNLTGTLYTDGGLTTQATGTAPVTLTYNINVASPSPVPQSTPTPSTDSNLPAYFNFNATSAINQCTNAAFNYSIAYYLNTIHTQLWFPLGAGSFSELQYWNYDNARVYLAAADLYLQQLDGTPWPDRVGSTAYGSSASNMAILPSGDPNGNVWLATVNGGTTASGGGPTWSSKPSLGQTLTDGTQVWMNMGTRTKWMACVKNSSEEYLNAVLLTSGGVSQFSQFSGAADRARQQTAPLSHGGAFAKSGTTVTGFYSDAEKVLINGSIGIGAFSQFSTNAGRGAAYSLDTLATYWRTVCQMGNCSLFSSNSLLTTLTWWQLNSTLNYWNMFWNQPQFSSNENLTHGPVIIPFYIGVGMEAAIELYDTARELDPANTLGFQDPRIIPALQQITGYMWTNWYNQCAAAGEGVNNGSFSYDPLDIQNHTIQEPFYTELSGPLEPAYDWMYAYCGGSSSCKLPDGTTYDVAADSIRLHQYDGRNCNNWTCTGGSRYYGHPWAGGTGTPKQFGQADKWGLGNSYYWRYVKSDYLTTDLSPSRNPCWSTGAANCASDQPFPDTKGPYFIQKIASGQDDPGNEGHFTGRPTSPVQNVASNSAQVQFYTYEATVSASVKYGTTQTCAGSTQSTEDTGYPQLQTGYPSNVTLWKHQFTLSGLLAATQYFIQLVATDAAGNTVTNSCTAVQLQGGGINFTTLGSTGLVILTTSIPAGAVNTPYTTTLQGSGGTPPYTWTITSGTLPSGITLNSSTGVISGTTAVGGSFPFTVQLSDSGGHTPATQPLTLVISSLFINTISLSNGTQGVAYSHTLIASGGTTPYTWSVLMGILPPGLSLDASTGVISGTPTTCGTYPITWKVTDAVGSIATRPIPITVVGCGLSILTTSPLPNGIVNGAYSTTLTAAGGTAPYTWAVTAGALPAGLSLNASTGVISGTPTTAGTASFTIRVTDSLAATASTPFTLTVLAASQGSITVTGHTTITGNVTLDPQPPPPSNP